MADRDAQALQAVSSLNIEKAVVDSSDARALEALLHPADIVINALP
ncbi:hypothetical protein ABTK11_20410 [Acinetobacter baumannii]